MRRFLLALALVFSASPWILAQQNIAVCTKAPVNNGRYKVLSMARSEVELQIYIEIRAKDRNDENYITIAKEFREKYCREAAFRLIYFRDKKHYRNFKPFGLDSDPSAIFFWANVPRTEKNGLVVYTVSEGNVEVRELVIDVPDPRK